MKPEEKKSALADIAKLKKEVLLMRIKSSSGDVISLKDYRNKKKNIAKLYTKINKKVK